MWCIRNWPIASYLAVPILAACSSHSHPQALAPADEIPAKVEIPGGIVTTGVAAGVLRDDVDVSAFSIAKTPTTVRQYKQCVAAGACSAPSLHDGPCAHSSGIAGDTFSNASGTPDRPVTCVTARQASQYCSWVGGRLPRPAEWTLAARGPKVHRYPWGDTDATCKERPNIGSTWAYCCGKPCDSDDAVAVGRHGGGDSPFGVSDVLLTRGEIVAADSSAAAYPGCHGRDSCVVVGTKPGAIDAFAAVSRAVPGSPVLGDMVASFRCVWEGDGE